MPCWRSACYQGAARLLQYLAVTSLGIVQSENLVGALIYRVLIMTPFLLLPDNWQIFTFADSAWFSTGRGSFSGELAFKQGDWP